MNELTDLGILFCKFLEHVGVNPLILFVMFLNLILANGNLSASCPVRGVYLQHLLKVCHGQTELIPKETSFPAAVQSLLIVLVQLNNLWHMQTQSSRVNRRLNHSEAESQLDPWAVQHRGSSQSPCCSSPQRGKTLSSAGSTTLDWGGMSAGSLGSSPALLTQNHTPFPARKWCAGTG